MHAELERGVNILVAFLEAPCHPSAHQVKSWLIPRNNFTRFGSTLFLECIGT